MRKAEAIIADLKHNIYWSQPNIRFTELMTLVNELENTLSPTEELVWSEPEVTEEPFVEAPVMEESIVEEVVEETTAEETVTEEPVVAKKTTKKK